MVFDLTVIGVVLLLAVFLVVLPGLPHWYAWSGEANYVRGVVLDLASTVYLATLTGIGIGFISPGFRLAPGGHFRRAVGRFWHSSA